MDGWMDGWVVGCTCVDVWVCRCVSGWVDEGMSGWWDRSTSTALIRAFTLEHACEGFRPRT